MRIETFGGLRARVTGGSDREGAGDGPVVVLLHGFGAPGDDLVPLWRVLDVPDDVRFVFPEAPIALPFGGRAWWPIDMTRLERFLERGQAAMPAGEVPPGLAPARLQVAALVDEAAERLGARSVTIGGFSQGAMLACDVALHTTRPLSSLVLFSGTLIAEREWAPHVAGRAGLRVLQSHGSADPLLAIAGAAQLRDLLRGGGLAVEWIEFRGGHEIPQQALERLREYV
jgi:phospholipase/carboxylesterase